MGEAAVKIIKNYKTPAAPGTYFRLLCMTGKNKGLSYFVSGKRVILGRGDTADVQVLDTKSSREHAEMTQVGDGYVISDLGSQNGITINDLKVKQHQLKDGDRVIIGQTVYKYSLIDVKPHMELVEVNEDDDLEEYEEEEAEEKPKKKKKAEDEAAKKKKLMIYGVVILLVVMMLPEDGAEKQKAPPTGRRSARGQGKNSIEYEPNKGPVFTDKQTKRKVEAIIQRGLREQREQNFFRAIEQFNLALIIKSDYGRASFYLQKAKQGLQDTVAQMMSLAKRLEGQLKYQAAVRTYCQVIEYLQDYPQDQSYIDAEKAIELLEEKLGMDKGEIKCF